MGRDGISWVIMGVNAPHNKNAEDFKDIAKSFLASFRPREGAFWKVQKSRSGIASATRWRLRSLLVLKVAARCGARAGGPCARFASGMGRQTACKPGSVSRPKPEGWPFLWDARYRTPRATDPGGDAETRCLPRKAAAPIWSCSRWGLPCRPRCRGRGALLPHPFTLAAGPGRTRRRLGGLLSVALSLGSPPPAVSRHRVSVEPGLSSTGAGRTRPAAAIRPSGAPCS